MLRIYIIGLAILIIAILANSLVVKIGLKSWYDFLNLVNEKGVVALKLTTIIDYLWLFIGYPLVLGFGYWIGDKIHNLIFG